MEGFPEKGTEVAKPSWRAASHSWREFIRNTVGINRAIAFTVMARGWSTFAGVVTILLIARFLSPAEQGYYYTFSSLVSLQLLFELGFSYVVLQLAAHESSRLIIQPNGEIAGPEETQSRLASVLQKSVRWYSVAAGAMFICVLPCGVWFFSTHTRTQIPVHWQLPWISVVIAATFTFQMDPIFSFIEGCGMVASVARLRLFQAMLGNIMAWTAFFLHHGLFAPALIISGQAIAGGIFIVRRRRFLLPLLRRKTHGEAISWQSEIWPFQWRMAISWICGYFIFQLFNPVLFAFRGAAEAGRMGMSLNIGSALGAISISWMSTKSSPFGRMIARREFELLDQVFFRALLQSSILLISGGGILLGGYLLVQKYLPLLAARVLSLPLLAILLLTTLCNHIIVSEALYLRAHKREPFLIQSILVAILTGTGTVITAKLWGATGVSISYFFCSGLFGLVCGTFIFFSKRRRWHTEAELSTATKENY
jgi:hypothetical protein